MQRNVLLGSYTLLCPRLLQSGNQVAEDEGQLSLPVVFCTRLPLVWGRQLALGLIFQMRKNPAAAVRIEPGVLQSKVMKLISVYHLLSVFIELLTPGNFADQHVFPYRKGS